jgi:glycosyltransferase involved in cell wall biosynthesis
MDLCWAYTIVRNEARMLPWWLRWYGSFCERLIVYDDHSDDGTAEIVQAADNAEVRVLPFSGLDDGEHVRFAEATYPEARGKAHWVAWVDADELITDAQAGMVDALIDHRTRGVHLPVVQGWQMYAAQFPDPAHYRAQLPAVVCSGLPDPNYSKAVIFDPQLELDFGIGRHSTAGAPLEPSTLRLLHFRYLGREYYTERSRRNYARLSERAKAAGWGGATYPENVEGEADMNEAAMQRASAV